MNRTALPVAFAVLLTGCNPPTLAEAPAGIPVIACIGTDGRWMRGSIDPTNYSGSFVARTSDGQSCNVEWRTNYFQPGIGRGSITCDDGLTAEVHYQNISRLGGVAIGAGTTNTGERISVWSGLRVPNAIAARNDFAIAPNCDGEPTGRIPSTGEDNLPSSSG